MKNIMLTIMLMWVMMGNDHDSLLLFGVFMWMDFVPCGLSVWWNYLSLLPLVFIMHVVLLCLICVFAATL